MAKSRTGTKSQAIEEYLAANKQAMPRQIVDALKEEGVEVSFGLASAVKYKKAGKTKTKNKTSARKAKRVAAVKNEVGVTGSESIRQFIAKNPTAGPKGIEAGLKAKGIQVSKALISAVKYSKKYSKAKKSGKKMRKMSRPATVRVAARATAAVGVTIKQLLAVKDFADAFGGSDQVRQALDILAQFR